MLTAPWHLPSTWPIRKHSFGPISPRLADLLRVWPPQRNPAFIVADFEFALLPPVVGNHISLWAWPGTSDWGVWLLLNGSCMWHKSPQVGLQKFSLLAPFFLK